MFFFGTYEHTIDDKGRVAVPRPWREALAESGHPSELIVTRGLPGGEPFLEGYTRDRWQKRRERISAAEASGLDGRPARRLLVGSAFPLSFDKQGRVLLPTTLREHARLVKDVLCVAVDDDMFELWDPKLFASQQEAEQPVITSEYYRKKLGS